MNFKQFLSPLPSFAIATLLLSCGQFARVDSIRANILTENGADGEGVKVVRQSRPALLSFKELSRLVEDPKPEGELAEKVDALFRTPFVDNRAYYRNGLPEPQVHPQLGPSIRVSSWNIEKSVRIDEVSRALTSPRYFGNQLRAEYEEDSLGQSEAMRQRAALAASDVLLLQEMDIGHCRSGYLFAAQHLARKLKMNFVYAPQQLEIDPVHLGLDHIRFDNGDTDARACRALLGKSATYKGVFGVAVLSRYPVKNVQLFQLKEQPYDWYEGEIKKPDFLEAGRRKGASGLFHFQPIREVKVGGRAFTRVDLHVPNLPLNTLTVINVHLEIKTNPKQRERQLKEILSYIKDIKNPVVMAGDFNSSAADVSSTSLARFSKNTTSDPRNLLAAGLHAAEVTGVSQIKTAINGFKNYRDPLAWNIPVILPNKTKGLFDLIENHRFDDGGAFDFRGDASRSTHGNAGKLSNSNQRHGVKGFTFTHSLPRPIGVIGWNRLDWIFVKSFLSAPNQKDGPYRMAPHFGETLGLMNLAVKQPFSDHHPITTVLPLQEPEG
jgi:endonuclease/exonuclease/phosphatase family metal-dependent hydrolase